MRVTHYGRPEPYEAWSSLPHSNQWPNPLGCSRSPQIIFQGWRPWCCHLLPPRPHQALLAWSSLLWWLWCWLIHSCFLLSYLILGRIASWFSLRARGRRFRYLRVRQCKAPQLSLCFPLRRPQWLRSKLVPKQFAPLLQSCWEYSAKIHNFQR